VVQAAAKPHARIDELLSGVHETFVLTSSAFGRPKLRLVKNGKPRFRPAWKLAA